MVLFVVTAITTTAVGAFHAGERVDSWFSFFLGGWVFSVPLMAILLAHEMGHYVAGRLHYLDLTPPYFIPGIPPFGTFGAFIKIRTPIYNRRVLMRVGACGPLAGALLAIPLLALGLYLSDAKPGGTEPVVGFQLGSSVILELLCYLRFGSSSANLTISLHPTALAAWFGLLVTAVNLLPIGQLDGGHVIYSLFGPRFAKVVSIIAFAALAPLGIFLCEAWIGFAVLALILGVRHPPPLDTDTPLDRVGQILGVCAIALFILTFVPAPITFVEPN